MFHQQFMPPTLQPLTATQAPVAFSESFYRAHGKRYAEINEENRQYVKTSDARFQRDADLLEDFM
ncbi:MAG: hypothetical protein PHV34_24225, partial [Verrucomicrobiae bacterium]|nr:hypothetical protein [Verrucomicrobiae bacterium]